VGFVARQSIPALAAFSGYLEDSCSAANQHTKKSTNHRSLISTIKRRSDAAGEAGQKPSLKCREIFYWYIVVTLFVYVHDLVPQASVCPLDSESSLPRSKLI
jgi:hypothetical protein